MKSESNVDTSLVMSTSPFPVANMSHAIESFNFCRSVTFNDRSNNSLPGLCAYSKTICSARPSIIRRDVWYNTEGAWGHVTFSAPSEPIVQPHLFARSLPGATATCVE
eukprot:CAMPEP_0178582406 /NCGR_PEP_ID=MMETSP0697-20121206/23710_1 /TAXON_ID=265572 /ORGANISM="Extubocellulus spinifer, Strain CCMP396" /LENGTH=107 /DNA_ID=CAMNT_0020218141 /DNA_START=232 /DNA_END=552 /DNA_ORIENTATION=+